MGDTDIVALQIVFESEKDGLAVSPRSLSERLGITSAATTMLIDRLEASGHIRRETIETEKGKKRAIRIHATTKYSGDHLKSGDLYFWFSDDESRTLLKARAKIKIGSRSPPAPRVSSRRSVKTCCRHLPTSPSVPRKARMVR